MSKLLYKSDEWTLDLIDKMWKVIDKIATTKYALTYYQPQIEIVTADQMMYHHSMNAMPTLYSHWSFGKQHMENAKQWEKGQTALAYETIINTDPMICYIMESNSSTMQALVLAHAVCGHGSFFANNYLFKEGTDAKSVMNTLRHAREFVKEAELKHGVDKVEKLLDALHSLHYHGIDRYKRRRIPRISDVAKKARARAQHEQETFDLIYETLKQPEPIKKETQTSKGINWPFPEENLLYFIEKHSPVLEPWEKEIVRIVRKSAQYFYPQIQTKVMNEGWASFWHYTLMTDLYDDGYISEGHYLEFIDSHTSVCCQRTHSTMNPYALGFEMFMDIKRACENPDDDDYKYLPLVAGKPWLETMKWVMENFKDETFVQELLGPRVIKHFGLFCVEDDSTKDEYNILTIQDKEDVYEIRKHLSKQYNFDSLLPNIEIIDYNKKGDRELTLQHTVAEGKTLEIENRKSMLKYISKLWGHPIVLKEVDEETGSTNSYPRRYS